MGDRPTWKDFAWCLAFGIGFAWLTWHLHGEFAALESGAVKSIRVWAPIAWVYNIGGIWATVAKWTLLVGLAAFSLGGWVAFALVLKRYAEYTPQPPSG
jgi:hypothetical protein